MNTTAYLIIRLIVGVSMLGHGLARLPKLAGFSTWMVSTFEKTMLPRFMVLPFSYLLPVTEFIVGLLLITGLATGGAAVAGAVVMMILIFGTCLLENWEALPSQLIHGLFFAALIEWLASNSWALDRIF